MPKMANQHEYRSEEHYFRLEASRKDKWTQIHPKNLQWVQRKEQSMEIYRRPQKSVELVDVIEQ